MFVLFVLYSKGQKAECRTVKKKKQLRMKYRVQDNTKKKKNPPGGHGCLSFVSVLCRQVEVSVMGRSLVQRSPSDCDVSLCVI